MTTLNKQKRQLLRRVQEHFHTTRRRHGALLEQTSSVDVYYHPHKAEGLYNYVTPRRGVAWVPGTDLMGGLDRLVALNRTPRLEMVEGLFPPAFHNQLKMMGLQIESEQILMTYGAIPGCDQDAPSETPAFPTPTSNIATFEVADSNAVATWLRLHSQGEEPDQEEVASLWHNVTLGQESYFLASDNLVIAGGAGVIFNPPIAEVVGISTIAPYRGRGVGSTAVRKALEEAQAHDCSLIITLAPDETAAKNLRRLGFVDLDHLITYQRPPQAVPSANSSTQAEANIA